MEGIELRARRVALGLSVAEAARLTGQNEKHWRDWEAGRRPITPTAETAIRALANTLYERLWELLDKAEEAYEATGEPVALFAYKTIEAFENAGGETHYGLPWSGHSALVGLALTACELDEIPAYIHGIHHKDND